MNFQPHLLLGSLVAFLSIGIGGCAGNYEHVELDPHAVGFEAPVPKAGTRVVVWGNHATAVDQASSWFHQQGLLVLDRTRLQQGFPDKQPRLTGSSKDWAHILEASNRVGADLVAFVEVSNVKGGQKFSLSQVRSSPSFALTVEIRGVKPRSGEIVTKSKAWQTGPAQEPDLVIEGLTTRALDEAWQSAESAPRVAVENSDESEKQTGNLLPLSAIQAPSGSLNERDLLGSGSRRASTLGNPDYRMNGANPNDDPFARRSGSLIATQSMDTRNGSDVSMADSPASLLRHNGAHNSPKNSSRVADPVMAASSEYAESSRMHREVDSTYLNELEPIPDAEQSSDSSSDSVGPQLASGALSILYTPAKLVYAGLGGIFGGLAYVLTAGDERAATSIWTGSLEGDYYLTPSHLKGDAPVEFMGPSTARE